MTVWTQLNSSDNWGGTYATPTQPGGTLSSGNLLWTPNTEQVHWVRAVDGHHSTGKYYFEATNTNNGQFFAGTYAGLMKATPQQPVDVVCTGFLGAGVEDGCYVNGTQLFAAPSFNHNAFVGWAVDLGAMKAWVHFHQTSAGSTLLPWNNDVSADPATGVNGLDLVAIFGAGATLFPVLQGASFSAGPVVPQMANFGGSAFNMTVPSGFTPGWPVSGAAVSAIPYVHIIT